MTDILVDLEHHGRGRRVKKTHWEEGNFWHIVDTKVVTENPTDDAASEEKTARLKRVSGVKFENNAPTTGRVTRILDAGKHGWVLLDSAQQQ